MILQVRFDIIIIIICNNNNIIIIISINRHSISHHIWLSTLLTSITTMTEKESSSNRLSIDISIIGMTITTEDF
jgi:hypothetical protein